MIPAGTETKVGLNIDITNGESPVTKAEVFAVIQ